MDQKDAFYLLFVAEYGSGPLFKSQTDLVTELLDNRKSKYHLSKKDDEYPKAHNRLKTYISQLFSDDARRSVTEDFRISLENILEQKTMMSDNYSVHDLTTDIISGLRKINKPAKIRSNANRKVDDLRLELLEDILDSRHISVFTSREINLEFDISNKFSLVGHLMEDAIKSAQQNTNYKTFNFNFPLEQTCILFWKAAKKQMVEYLQENKNHISFLLSALRSLNILKNKNEISENAKNESSFEENIADSLLKFFSDKRIINVFYLNAPVYLVPFIALNANAAYDSCIYILLQTEHKADNIHRLSPQEFFHWKVFVWENLRLNNYGRIIPYK